jgi:glycosyltransferase involved in cell wall biosynthesis
MKIVQIVSYYPPHLGGMENAVKEISESLAKRGHQVKVFTSDIGCKKDKLTSTKNLEIHYLNSFEFAHSSIIPFLFFKLLTIPKDSIIHLHVAQAFVPEIVYLVSKIKKISYVLHLHADVGPSGKLGFLLPFYKNVILKRILKSSRKIIVLNNNYKTLVNRKYHILENITVIPNGINEEFFIDKRITSSRYTNLLFVGRLSIEKNVSKLVEAVSLLESRVVLDIVGDGEKRNEIEKLILDKKLKNVILHGKKTGKDLIKFYKNADIFLLASDYEGLPLVLLEAMASGTPIIVSDVIGIRELVGKTGILVNPPTPENFAKAINNLIEDKKLRNTLSVSGREKAKGYDWDKIIEKFEDVYREVLYDN